MQKDLDTTIQQKLREIHRSVLKIKAMIIMSDPKCCICQEEMAKNSPGLQLVQKTHEKVQNEQKQSHYFKNKLRGLYKTAAQEMESEIEATHRTLELIQEVRALKNEKWMAFKNSERPKETLRRGALMKMLQQSALTLPLWIPRKKEPPPPLCGAIPAEPNYVLKVGSMVAALVRGPDDENWILAEVMGYNPSTNKYEVDDIDEEQKERHLVSRRRMVPLPLMRANPESNPEALFPPDTLVMALYPQTTCFYRALVHEPPHKARDDYQVLFEDPSYTDGYSPPMSVGQRYVILCKDSKKK
ncbi:CCDC101 [Cordylochernes scorpioides]|uniref:CCDC101 n=1 Tax=Cordylochernes scorpioides TaxID=51811 RepID=A0ABY6KBW1_9ARAC|nr:CCDC101 [Cordylochernes scorpioides]